MTCFYNSFAFPQPQYLTVADIKRIDRICNPNRLCVYWVDGKKMILTKAQYRALT